MQDKNNSKWVKKTLEKIMTKLVLTSHNNKQKVKRKGVHAKSKNSKLKSCKNYKKKYKGQGR